MNPQSSTLLDQAKRLQRLQLLFGALASDRQSMETLAEEESIAIDKTKPLAMKDIVMLARNVYPDCGEDLQPFVALIHEESLAIMADFEPHRDFAKIEVRADKILNLIETPFLIHISNLIMKSFMDSLPEAEWAPSLQP
jgi:hypothetical protein